MTTAIKTDGLTKRYGDFTAVDQLDLDISEGEIFGLLGPNGAGKTTTILMLLGLSEPSGGRAEVAGLDPTTHPLDVKSLVGYVPDNVGFYNDMSGRQNLRYTARLNSVPDEVSDQRITSILERVGLADDGDKNVGTYSRGMRQRLGMADALVKEPQILILDEPTIGIDPEGLREIFAFVEELRDEKKLSVLLSSHLLHQVQTVCDRVAIFVGGKVRSQGSLQELAPTHRPDEIEIEIAVTDWEAAGEALWTIPGVKKVDRETDFWVVIADEDVRSDIARVFTQKGIEIVHLRKREESLDDIYRRYFETHDDGN